MIQASTGTSPEIAVTQDEVEECFSKVCERNAEGDNTGMLREEEALAKFKLIRFDQLSEVAELLLDDQGPDIPINSVALAKALEKIHDAELKKVSNHARFAESEAHARRDYERVPTYEIDGEMSDEGVMRRLRETKALREENGKFWLKWPLERIRRKYIVCRVGDDGKLALQARPTDPR